MGSPRKLRSSSENKTAKLPDRNLFNFNNINPYIYLDKPIAIRNDEGEERCLPKYHYYSDETVTPPFPLSSSISLTLDSKPSHSSSLPTVQEKRTSRLTPRRAAAKNLIADPLPDSLYTIFHRKMRRDEKQMLNDELLRTLSELDTLQHYKQLLDQYDWIRHLPQITYIDNPKDLQDMEWKKQLTLAEIDRLILRQVEWRKKRDEFVIEVKNYHAENKTVPTEKEIEDEYELSIINTERYMNQQQKLKRIDLQNIASTKDAKTNNELEMKPETKPESKPESKRIKNLGGHTAETIIKAKPKLKSTKVDRVAAKIKEDKQARDVHNKKGPEPRKRTYSRAQKLQLEDVDPSLEINLCINTSESDDYYFGVDFQNIPASINGFQLPRGLRKFGQSTESQPKIDNEN